MSILVGDEDTICALSTPEGLGGIAVIRVSGSSAVVVTKKLCRFLPDQLESHKVYYGVLKSPVDDAPIDEVLITFFKEGKSFTGEEVIEISSHGSPYLVSTILSTLTQVGCRMAKPGEFSYRAYLNGRIDLVQAEGVLNLIHSKSKESSRAAISHLRGQISNNYKKIEDALMSVVCQLEASIDFVHENLDTENYENLCTKILDIREIVCRLLDSFNLGRQLKEGCRILIMGPVNAGKSSLMNLICGEEKSIVTPIAGTTRDIIEGKINVGGIEVAIFDSAGIRNSTEPVEIEGIRRAQNLATQVEHILFVVDLTGDYQEELGRIENLKLQKDNILIIGNKLDLSDSRAIQKFDEVFCEFNKVCISSATKENFDLLKVKLTNQIKPNIISDAPIVTQSRHVEILRQVRESLDRGQEGLSKHISPELVVADLREGVNGIHELLGIKVDERVLDRIFKEFCIGK